MIKTKVTVQFLRHQKEFGMKELHRDRTKDSSYWSEGNERRNAWNKVAPKEAKAGFIPLGTS